MPPPAPSTATLVCRAELVEKARVWVDKRRVAERVNMTDERKGVDAGSMNINQRPLTPMLSEFYTIAILRGPDRTTDSPLTSQLRHHGHLAANDGDALWHLVFHTPNSSHTLLSQILGT